MTLPHRRDRRQIVLLTSAVPVDPTGAATLTFTVPSGLTGPLGQPEVVRHLGPGWFCYRKVVQRLHRHKGTVATFTSPLAGYHLRISALDWWNNSSNLFVPSSPGSQASCQGNTSLTNSGIQQLTATATAQDGAGNKLAFVVTDPGTEDPQLSSSQPGVTTFTLWRRQLRFTLNLT